MYYQRLNKKDIFYCVPPLRVFGIKKSYQKVFIFSLFSSVGNILGS